MAYRSFEDLKVWKSACDLAVNVQLMIAMRIGKISEKGAEIVIAATTKLGR